MFNKILLFMLICFGGLHAGKQEKMYIDEQEFAIVGDAFHIHIGNNVWLVTETVHRDRSGMFTYQEDITRSQNKNGHVKEWKCPYCYMFWPIGKPCQNEECASRYK